MISSMFDYVLAIKKAATALPLVVWERESVMAQPRKPSNRDLPRFWWTALDGSALSEVGDRVGRLYDGLSSPSYPKIFSWRSASLAATQSHAETIDSATALGKTTKPLDEASVNAACV